MTILVEVENRPGELARIVNLFAARGVNIDTLAVSGADAENVSTITVTTTTDPRTSEQLVRLMEYQLPAMRGSVSGAPFAVSCETGSLSLTARGSNCLLRVSGKLVFTGTIEGEAIGTTSALTFATCEDVISNPPGSFSDVFRSELHFTGSVDGTPAEGDLMYQGRAAPGGAGLGPAFLPGWGQLTPFLLETGAQFRPAREGGTDQHRGSPWFSQRERQRQWRHDGALRKRQARDQHGFSGRYVERQRARFRFQPRDLHLCAQHVGLRSHGRGVASGRSGHQLL